MQKKVIALAIAGLVSGAAFAQTNVTVYGVADVDYTYSKSDSNAGKVKFSGIRDGVDNGLNGSRVGFKGEEALGNGLKAIFLTEIRVQQATGDQTQPMRQAFVGLNSASVGTFTLGRQYSAAGDVYANNNSNGVVSVMPVNVLQGQGGSTIVSAGGNSRQSNAVKYVSPTWSGFTGRISYAFSDNMNTTTSAANPTVLSDAKYSDNGRWALSADYANGPFSADVILAKTQAAYLTGTNAYYNSALGGSNTGGTPTAAAQVDPNQGKDINEWYIGAGWDFKVVKIVGGYQEAKNKNGMYTPTSSATVGGPDKSKMWQVGLSAPIGNGSLQAEYADLGFSGSNSGLNGHEKGYGLGYVYNMSKRTSLYGFVSSIKYDSDVPAAATGLTTATNGGVNAPFVGSASVGTAVAGERQSNLSVGIRHFF
jgi:predicted porin